jgi:hypothetical protein
VTNLDEDAAALSDDRYGQCDIAENRITEAQSIGCVRWPNWLSFVAAGLPVSLSALPRAETAAAGIGPAET